jgi:hypothetical protein
MISKEQIETFAAEIADPAFKMQDIGPLIGHLSDSEFDAVLERAKEIARSRANAAHAEADSLENVQRLAHAAGMPAGEKPIPWLAERGLIEKIGDGWRFKAAKPSAIG